MGDLASAGSTVGGYRKFGTISGRSGYTSISKLAREAPAPSLFEQFGDVLRGLPGGLAEFAGKAAQTVVAPFHLAWDATQGDMNVDSFGDFTNEYLPFGDMVARSLGHSAMRLRHPSRYLRAIERGEIVGTVLEDLGNAAIVAGGLGKALGSIGSAGGAAAAASAAEAGAAAGTIGEAATQAVVRGAQAGARGSGIARLLNEGGYAEAAQAAERAGTMLKHGSHKLDTVASQPFPAIRWASGKLGDAAAPLVERAVTERLGRPFEIPRAGGRPLRLSEVAANGLVGTRVGRSALFSRLTPEGQALADVAQRPLEDQLLKAQMDVAQPGTIVEEVSKETGRRLSREDPEYINLSKATVAKTIGDLDQQVAGWAREYGAAATPVEQAAVMDRVAGQLSTLFEGASDSSQIVTPEVAKILIDDALGRLPAADAEFINRVSPAMREMYDILPEMGRQGVGGRPITAAEMGSEPLPVEQQRQRRRLEGRREVLQRQEMRAFKDMNRTEVQARISSLLADEIPAPPRLSTVMERGKSVQRAVEVERRARNMLVRARQNLRRLYADYDAELRRGGANVEEKLAAVEKQAQRVEELKAREAELRRTQQSRVSQAKVARAPRTEPPPPDVPPSSGPSSPDTPEPPSGGGGAAPAAAPRPEPEVVPQPEPEVAPQPAGSELRRSSTPTEPKRTTKLSRVAERAPEKPATQPAPSGEGSRQRLNRATTEAIDELEQVRKQVGVIQKLRSALDDLTGRGPRSKDAAKNSARYNKAVSTLAKLADGTARGAYDELRKSGWMTRDMAEFFDRLDDPAVRETLRVAAEVDGDFARWREQVGQEGVDRLSALLKSAEVVMADLVEKIPTAGELKTLRRAAEERIGMPETVKEQQSYLDPLVNESRNDARLGVMVTEKGSNGVSYWTNSYVMVPLEQTGLKLSPGKHILDSYDETLKGKSLRNLPPEKFQGEPFAAISSKAVDALLDGIEKNRKDYKPAQVTGHTVVDGNILLELSAADGTKAYVREDYFNAAAGPGLQPIITTADKAIGLVGAKDKVISLVMPVRGVVGELGTEGQLRNVLADQLPLSDSLPKGSKAAVLRDEIRGVQAAEAPATPASPQRKVPRMVTPPDGVMARPSTQTRIPRKIAEAAKPAEAPTPQVSDYTVELRQLSAKSKPQLLQRLGVEIPKAWRKRKGAQRGMNAEDVFDGLVPERGKAFDKTGREMNRKPLRSVEEVAKEAGDDAIVVISCGNSKLGTAAAAADLYTSDYFKKNLEAARAITGGDDSRIRILSAKHGYLPLDEVIEPYEVSFKFSDEGVIDVNTLRRQARGLPDKPVVVLGGKEYTGAVVTTIGDRHVVAPFVGSEGIGAQKKIAGEIAGSARRAESPKLSKQAPKPTVTVTAPKVPTGDSVKVTVSGDGLRAYDQLMNQRPSTKPAIPYLDVIDGAAYVDPRDAPKVIEAINDRRSELLAKVMARNGAGAEGAMRMVNGLDDIAAQLEEGTPQDWSKAAEPAASAAPKLADTVAPRVVSKVSKSALKELREVAPEVAAQVKDGQLDLTVEQAGEAMRALEAVRAQHGSPGWDAYEPLRRAYTDAMNGIEAAKTPDPSWMKVVRDGSTPGQYDLDYGIEIPTGAPGHRGAVEARQRQLFEMVRNAEQTVEQVTLADLRPGDLLQDGRMVVTLYDDGKQIYVSATDGIDYGPNRQMPRTTKFTRVVRSPIFEPADAVAPKLADAAPKAAERIIDLPPAERQAAFDKWDSENRDRLWKSASLGRAYFEARRAQGVSVLPVESAKIGDILLDGREIVNITKSKDGIEYTFELRAEDGTTTTEKHDYSDGLLAPDRFGTPAPKAAPEPAPAAAGGGAQPPAEPPVPPASGAGGAGAGGGDMNVGRERAKLPTARGRRLEAERTLGEADRRATSAQVKLARKAAGPEPVTITKARDAVSTALDNVERTGRNLEAVKTFGELTPEERTASRQWRRSYTKDGVLKTRSAVERINRQVGAAEERASVAARRHAQLVDQIERINRDIADVPQLLSRPAQAEIRDAVHGTSQSLPAAKRLPEAKVVKEKGWIELEDGRWGRVVGPNMVEVIGPNGKPVLGPDRMPVLKADGWNVRMSGGKVESVPFEGKWRYVGERSGAVGTLQRQLRRLRDPFGFLANREETLNVSKEELADLAASGMPTTRKVTVGKGVVWDTVRTAVNRTFGEDAVDTLVEVGDDLANAASDRERYSYLEANADRLGLNDGELRSLEESMRVDEKLDTMDAVVTQRHNDGAWMDLPHELGRLTEDLEFAPQEWQNARNRVRFNFDDRRARALADDALNVEAMPPRWRAPAQFARRQVRWYLDEARRLANDGDHLAASEQLKIASEVATNIRDLAEMGVDPIYVAGGTPAKTIGTVDTVSRSPLPDEKMRRTPFKPLTIEGAQRTQLDRMVRRLRNETYDRVEQTFGKTVSQVPGLDGWLRDFIAENDRYPARDEFVNAARQMGWVPLDRAKGLGATKAVDNAGRLLEDLQQAELNYDEAIRSGNDARIQRARLELDAADTAHQRSVNATPKVLREAWGRYETARVKLQKMLDQDPEGGSLEGRYSTDPDVLAAAQKEFDQRAAELAAAEEAALPKLVPDTIAREMMRDASLWDRGTLPGFRLLARANRAYKTQVLPLSARWYINNTIGNVIMAGVFGGIGPAELFRQIKRLRSEVGFKGVGRKSQSMLEADLLGGALDVGGVRGGRIVQSGLFENQRRGLGLAEFDTPDARTRPGRVLRKVTDYGYGVNEFFDNVSRSAVYLAKLERNVKEMVRRGLVDEANPSVAVETAAKAALRDTLRAMGDYTNMAPWQRKYLRQVFPWWSWIRHSTVAAMRLPIEHPMRTAWLAQLSVLANDEGLTGAELAFFSGKWMLGEGSSVNLGSLSPLENPLENPIVNPTSLLRSMSPALKVGIAGLTGLDMGRLQQVTRPPKDRARGAFGQQVAEPLAYDPAGLLGYAFGQLPMARNLRDFIDGPSIRYGTGEPIKDRSGRPIPSGKTRGGALAAMFGVPFPETMTEAERKRREKQRERLGQ